MTVLVDSAVRAILFACIVGGVLALLRVKRTVIRLGAWTLVLWAALAMPALGGGLPAWRVPVSGLQALSWLPSLAASDPQSGVPAPNSRVGTSATVDSKLITRDTRAGTQIGAAGTVGTAGSGTSATTPPPFGLSRLLIVIYLVGAVALGLRSIFGWTATRRLERSSQSVDDSSAMTRLARAALRAGLRRPPRLVESSELFVPVTMSVVRPIVVLPATWRAWDPETLEAVLTHEIAHIARRDALSQHAALIYRAVFWFNPLAWWLRHQLVQLAERASDEAVLHAGTSQTDYARMLVEFFRAVPAKGHRADWHVAMARGTAAGAEARVERILAWKGGSDMRLSRSLILAIALAAAPGVTLTALVRPTIMAPVLPAVSLPAMAPALKVESAAPLRLGAATASVAAPRRVISEPPRRDETMLAVASQVQPAEQPIPGNAAAQSPTPIQDGFGAGSYRPGGGVAWPKDTHQVKPMYTDEARSQGLEGVVELEALVLPDGTVGPVRITKSLDTQFGLDREAVLAVRQWTFRPGQLGGEPVPVIVPFQLEFRLGKADAPAPSAGARVRPLNDEFARGAYFMIGDLQVVPKLLGSAVYTPEQMRVKLTTPPDSRNGSLTVPRETGAVWPTYTVEALRAQIQGQVDVEVIVMPDGTVGKARVVRSLDTVYGLDEQALTAARLWTFIPGTLDGKPVPMLGTISLTFKVRR